MQALTLFMIAAVTTFEFFTRGDPWGRWAFLPNGSQYIPELLSAMTAALVIFAGPRGRFELVRAPYWFAFGVLLVTMAAGVATNGVEAGPIFAGMRTYLRAIPWFFVPVIYAFTELQLRTQLRLLLLVCVLQSPLALQQTLTTVSRGFEYTGDFTVGTLLLSPTLSIFLICGISIAAAFFARKRLTLWQFLFVFAALLFPAAINETKATLVLLPIGVVTAFLAASPVGKRLRYALGAGGVLALFIVLFVPIYDYLLENREGSTPIVEMASDPELLRKYLIYGKGVGATGEVGKGDAMLVSLRIAAADPVHLAFGYGIGNVSESALGYGFTGRYFRVYGPFKVTSFGAVVLEWGLLGLVSLGALMFLVYKDSLVVAARDRGILGAIAAGMAGVTVVMLVSIVYTDVVAPASLSYLFWYLAGLVASGRSRVMLEANRSSSAGCQMN